ncbi:MAG TPA: HTH domain-containing protein [Bacteroidia bacterium]|nr:HTH domain-containing protein [Bacteroidia bacterium]
MKFDDYQEKLEQIDKLIRYSNTGSPKELARRMRVSERTIRRFIEKLKTKNDSIHYCRRLQSYVIKN